MNKSMTKKMNRALALTLLIINVGILSAGGNQEPFHETVDYVDMEKFSGDWYVIALIPTSFEKDAAWGIENYSLDEKGHIRVEYTFRKGSRDGKEKVMYQKGWIADPETNADWRVQPLWPLKLPYYILELDEDYTYTVIGTNNYKYLWIMSRESQMDAALLRNLFDRMEDRGFTRKNIKIMDQSGRPQ